MTFREKLADWISGGKLSEAVASSESYSAAYFTLSNHVSDIYLYVSHQKSGTAQKVSRMCRAAWNDIEKEALEE